NSSRMICAEEQSQDFLRSQWPGNKVLEVIFTRTVGDTHHLQPNRLQIQMVLAPVGGHCRNNRQRAPARLERLDDPRLELGQLALRLLQLGPLLVQRELQTALKMLYSFSGKTHRCWKS